jgi:REP element-mobilizing transposase RayT
MKKTWGGKRDGAGRKNVSKTVTHMKRERVHSHYPMHLTVRLRKSMPNLRQRRLQRALHKGILMSEKLGLRVIHYAMQTNHLHLIVEAKDNPGLARGMQSLIGRMGKIIRRYIGGKGSVFAGRYHLRVIKTASYMKNVLKYVLFNSARHLDVIEHIDSFSSADSFTKWRQLLGRKLTGFIAAQVATMTPRKAPDVFAPKTWLASVGWQTG